MSAAIQIGLSVLFGVSGALKLSNLPAFYATVQGYNILPDLIVAPVGVLIAVGEIVLSLWLLSGIRVRPALMVTTSLLLAFTGAIAWAWAGGHIDECGCVLKAVGVKEGAILAMARNGVLIALCSISYWRKEDA